MFKIDQLTNKKYVITGRYYNSNKYFSAIYTDTPQHYNIWNGTIWELVVDQHGIKHRKKLVRIYN